MVGIGASAGGLEAFQQLFSGMPADSGMAFVLVQHLDPRHETLMPELLSRHTSMPVQLVTEDTRIETDRIYVTPPNATVTIDDCELKVTRPERARGRRMPIDSFFRSLAEDQGDDAVAIVLSGTGADGALGVRAVREHGGMTMVQFPASARYDSMPRSAILTGMVDHVLPLEDMPARLMEHLRQLSDLRGGGPEGMKREVEAQLVRICAVLRRRTGHDFSRYKQSTLVRRIRRRMAELRTASAAGYLELLSGEPAEVDQLFRDLLIGVTHFFRDEEAFAALERKVIPQLFGRKGVDEHVRVWVPGCSTGEEAYSLAILLREHASTLDEAPHVQIFATDIDPQALEAARQAWYPERIAEQVSPERLERFFVKHGNMYQVSKEIREMCLFSTHNIITDPPFSRLDLISCRNVLIYMETDLQRKLIPLCHYALRSGGFLFLGPSESVASYPELFRALDKRLRIFQAKDVVLRPPVSFPLAERSRYTQRHLLPAGNDAGRPLRTGRPEVSGHQGMAQVFERILLDHYSPACVVVNERGDIVYFSPRTGRYLEPPAGAPSLNVLDMARPGLRLDLRTALHKAVTSRAPVAHADVAFEMDGQRQRADLSVRPLLDLEIDQELFLIVFQESAEPRATDGEDGGTSAAPSGDAEAASATDRRLEAELRSTKEHLHATLEELESSNEELVSSNEELLAINEELQSTNEELQTSKEELQSVNEELETINTELKKKIEELDRAHSDLLNLFQSTQIATLFVGRDLRIQRFTPAATDVFRLIASDAGRLIEDIAPRFAGDGDLVEDIRYVLRTLSVRERQVRLLDGDAWYILRVLPYRTVEDVIDGVVITFVDVTEIKQAEKHRARLAAIVESSHDAILGKTLDGTIVSWNAGAERMYGYTPQEVIGRPVSILAAPERLEELGPIFDQLQRGQRVEPFETERVRKDGTRLNVLLTVSPILDADGRIVEASAIAHDITQQKRAQAALEEESRRKDEFLAMLGHELRNPLAPIRNCLRVLEQPNATSDHVRRARETIGRQLTHMTRLVDDLLDVSRISRGKILLRTSRLELGGLVRATIEDYRGESAAAGVEVATDIAGTPLWVTADATRLSQAIGNLLHNAIKFTDPGGRIRAVVRAEGGEAVVLVHDTGAGMDAETLARAFEPFSQGEAGIDRSRGGLGLGLALVKRLVELHGGTVEARSQGPGRGSEIEIRLALEEWREPVPEGGPETAAARGNGGSRRCLVIEDNPDAAESMGLLLELAGHRVEIAHDGPSGLEAARRFQPEVVLCDIGLPGGMDGYEVARRMRHDPALRRASLIALTGYGQEEDQRLAREAGFDVHLTKPADPDALARLLVELP